MRALAATALLLLPSFALAGELDTQIALCPTDAFACEHAAFLVPLDALDKACGAGSDGACIAAAVSQVGRPQPRKAYRAQLDVLAKECAKGHHAACALQAKHTRSPRGKYFPPEYYAYTAVSMPKLPPGAQIQAACAAQEPLACLLLEPGDGRAEAAFETSGRSDPEPASGSGEAYEDSKAASAGPSLVRACKAGSPRACHHLAVRELETESSMTKHVARLGPLCKAGVFLACLELHEEGRDAMASEKLASERCDRGDGDACEWFGQRHRIDATGSRLLKLLSRAWKACGSGCCRLSEYAYDECTAAAESLGEESTRVRQELDCVDGSSSDCRQASARLVGKDDAEALHFADLGCARGDLHSCRAGLKLGAKPDAFARALVNQCTENSCELERSTSEQLAWFRSIPEARAVLANRCSAWGAAKACTLLAEALTTGLWGMKDPAGALQAHGYACRRKDAAACTKLTEVVTARGPFAARAAELLCQADMADACKDALVPKQPMITARFDLPRNRFGYSEPTVVDGHAVIPATVAPSTSGYKVVSLDSGADMVTGTFVEPLVEIPRPSREGLAWGWETMTFPSFATTPAGRLAAMATMARDGLTRRGELLVWAPGKAPVTLHRPDGKGWCAPFAVRPDGLRGWAGSCDGEGLLEELDLATGAPTGPSIDDKKASPVALAADGRRLVYVRDPWSGSMSDLVLYDVQTKAAYTFENTDRMSNAHFATSGTRVAISGQASRGWVWDVSTTPRRAVALGIAVDARFSPDGRLVAVAGSDGARLVDAETGAWRSPAFPGRFETAEFTADGARVLFSGDGKAIVVQVDPTVAPPAAKAWVPLKPLATPTARPLPETRRDFEFRMSVICRSKGVAGAKVEAVASPRYAESAAYKEIAPSIPGWTATTDKDGFVHVTGLAGAVFLVTSNAGGCKLSGTYDAATSFPGSHFVLSDSR